jgi:hypothetical protein
MKHISKKYTEFELSKNVTVGEIEMWIAKFDRESKDKLVDFIQSRFDERYLFGISKLKDFGFLKMSVGCYMIETLQCFKMGEEDSEGKSRCMFNCFFEEEANFCEFRDFADDFYYNIRCGILHQSETTNGWRILCRGPLIDTNEYTINADKFINALKESLYNYMQKLTDAESQADEIWKRLINKLQSIINNCNRGKVRVKKNNKIKECICKPLP